MTESSRHTPGRAHERAAILVRIAGGMMLLGTFAVVGWLLLARTPPQAVTTPGPQLAAAANSAPPTLAGPQKLASPAIAVTTADGPTIMAHRSESLTVFRMAENPRVLVLDFPTLHEQGQMLNRTAAMVEKSGLPHDRVLDDAELSWAIHERKSDPDTFYYGHDYAASSLAAFFAAVDRQHVTLTAGETLLRNLLAQEHPGAIITLTQPDQQAGVDAAMRDTIFQHERSHGEYFTNPAYATFVQQFWKSELTSSQRASFTKYLASEDYDPGLEDLMVNETQAYLMHTRDKRFFDPTAAGLTVSEVERLRLQFLAGMPAGWLRDCFTNTAALRH